MKAARPLVHSFTEACTWAATESTCSSPCLWCQWTVNYSRGSWYDVRAVGLVSAPGRSQDRLVFLGLPGTNTAVEELVLGGGLVDHVRHPGVPLLVSDASPLLY